MRCASLSCMKRVAEDGQFCDSCVSCRDLFSEIRALVHEEARRPTCHPDHSDEYHRGWTSLAEKLAALCEGELNP